MTAKIVCRQVASMCGKKNFDGTTVNKDSIKKSSRYKFFDDVCLWMSACCVSFRIIHVEMRIYRTHLVVRKSLGAHEQANLVIIRLSRVESILLGKPIPALLLKLKYINYLYMYYSLVSATHHMVMANDIYRCWMMRNWHVCGVRGRTTRKWAS